VGYAQKARDRAAVGAPAHQCCNGGLRQQACAHRLGDHDARKSIQSCSGFCYHAVIGWCNKRERIKSARVKEVLWQIGCPTEAWQSPTDISLEKSVKCLGVVSRIPSGSK